MWHIGILPTAYKVATATSKTTFRQIIDFLFPEFFGVPIHIGILQAANFFNKSISQSINQSGSVRTAPRWSGLAIEKSIKYG